MTWSTTTWPRRQDSGDDLVVTTLVDEAGITDNDGADLFEQLRKGITRVQAQGFTPTIAAISPEDAETLDLSRSVGSTTDDGPFILDPAPRSQASSPLWDLRLRIVKGLANPIVIDPTCVRLYFDPIRFDADPYSAFTTNETQFR